MLSTQGRFIRADTHDAQYFFVTNQRRRFRGIAAAAVHLASQVICDIYLFKTRKEASLNKSLSNKEVAELYRLNLAGADGDEEPRSSDTTIQNAIVVFEKMFSNADVRSIIEQMDRE